MTDRDQIWFLVPALVVGGAERTLIDVANGLDHERFEVVIWTIFQQNPLADEISEIVELRTLGVDGVVPEGQARIERARNPVAYVRAPLEFVAAVRRERPDILQSFLRYDNIVAQVAGACASETTTIAGVRSVPNDPVSSDVVLDRLSMLLADVVVSNSNAGAELAREYGARENNVTVIHNGRPLETFRAAGAAGLYEEFDIPHDAPVVGTVGRLIRRKGHHDLLRAWVQVRDRCDTAELVLVGDGPERDALSSLATELGVSSTVHFVGTRDDVPQLLDLFDVFVFPSYFEGLPGAVIEAMAAGLPIVATPVDGTKELIDNYRTGLHVSVGEPDELAWALARLLEHDQLADQLGSAASETATRAFTQENMVSEFETLYDLLLNQ